MGSTTDSNWGKKINDTLESKQSRNVAQVVGCSQSAVSKIWTKYKHKGKIVKE